MAGRYRFVLAHDEPELLPYDQDLWVDGLHRDDEDPEELLRIFEPVRASDAVHRATCRRQHLWALSGQTSTTPITV